MIEIIINRSVARFNGDSSMTFEQAIGIIILFVVFGGLIIFVGASRRKE